MKVFNLVLSILLPIFISSCSSYIQGIHNQISQEEQEIKMKRYQRYNPKAAQNIRNPRTLQNIPNTSNTPNLSPRSNRNYQNPGKKRVSADDLKDNSNSGSLWSGKNSESYLFVTNNVKRVGDFVIIEVMAKMKKDITTELKRNFPPRPSKKATATEAKPKSDEAQASSEEDSNKVYDKISTQVVERINKDYLLLRGRKEVLFQKIKRYIQVQAVVSVKDIQDNDSVSSERLLEPKINVLRY